MKPWSVHVPQPRRQNVLPLKQPKQLQWREKYRWKRKNVCAKPFQVAVKSNLLYDAALVPNIGAEFYLGRGWTIGASWWHAWWKNDRAHNYWRIYGGELDVRKYLGKRSQTKSIRGSPSRALPASTDLRCRVGRKRLHGWQAGRKVAG